MTRVSSTFWTEPGYAETNRRNTGNRMNTDYSEAAKKRLFKDKREDKK